MQQILNVVTKATSYDLVTLDEMKAILQIPTADTSHDEMLQAMITNISETVAKECNRIFGYETVDETYYQLEDDCSRRLYLSQWPVVLADITAFTQNGTDLFASSNQWVLEEETGTLYRLPNYGPWYGVIDVAYSGGYRLPDDAPGPLKFAAQAVIRESYMGFIRNKNLYGVRTIRHKESSQMFYAPNMLSTMGAPATWQTVKTVLNKYIRQWV